MTKKLFRNCRIYTPVDNGKPATGKMQECIVHYPHGAVLVENGKISRIGDEVEVLDGLSPGRIVKQRFSQSAAAAKYLKSRG